MVKSKKKDKLKQNILDTITPKDAQDILKTLAKDNTNITKRIEQLAREHLSDVNTDDIARQVYSELDSIDVEELWDRSGSTRYGYIDPNDMACEMFEEALDPLLEELEKYQKLSMSKESKNYCMGLLKGIYQFEKKSKSKYKEWALDIPAEYFGMVLTDWEKNCKISEDIKEIKEFIHSRPQNCGLQAADRQWPLSISLKETTDFRPRSFIRKNCPEWAR